MFGLASLSARVAGIVREAVGVLARLGPVRAEIGPLLVAIHCCVERRLRRFERLMARVIAGRPAVVQRTGAERAKRGGGRRAGLVPRGYGWAVRMAPGTAAFGTQLQALLAEPAVAEMLRRTPEAAAALRPLCRMLAMPMIEATLQLPQAGPKAPRKRAVQRRQPGQEPWPGFGKNRPSLETLCWALARRVREPPW